MPDLLQSLQGRDLGHLRIIALLWGIELDAPDVRVGLPRLVNAVQDEELLAKTLEGLPSGAANALQDLLSNEGRLPWALFSRRYGLVRDMGPARRDRERPFDNAQANATEALWYRALIGRAFFDGPDGPEEFAYIPDDWLSRMPAVEASESRPLGRPASPAERDYPIASSDWILDDATTLLSALRAGILPDDKALLGPQPVEMLPYPVSARVLSRLLAAAGLLEAHGATLPEAARAFLETPRGEALAGLFRGWLRSVDFNELRLLPGLAAEGEWSNDPLRSRHTLLDFLSTVPGGFGPKTSHSERPWWSLGAFIAAIKQTYPDFQRPAGDYDSFFLRDEQGGEFLRGFENWDRVDGELVRYLIAGPLHWLGVTELALPEAPVTGMRQPVTAFRFSSWAADLLALKAPVGLLEETEPAYVTSDGRIRLPKLAPRVARYQIARFCAWEGYAQDAYQYRVTPESMQSAGRQGLQARQFLTLLRRYARAVPPGLVQALERWEAHGSQARLEHVAVLRVNDPAILQALRTSRAGRFLGEPLGNAAVIVRAGAWQKVVAALAELGYLAEVSLED